MGYLEVCCKTDIGKVRTHNEDSLIVLELGDMHVLAVADGLGGHAAGEVASKVALIEIENYLRAHLGIENQRETMHQAIAKANKEVFSLSKENPEYAGMGTTLVLALVTGNTVLLANIGDSRAYVIENGIRQITKDHSLVQELVDNKLITETEAFGHPRKNVITRTLGTEENVLPDFYQETASGMLLLCSDGLSDMLTDGEILEVTTSAPDLTAACTSLIDLANAKGGRDNITAIMARGLAA